MGASMLGPTGWVAVFSGDSAQTKWGGGGCDTADMCGGSGGTRLRAHLKGLGGCWGGGIDIERGEGGYSARAIPRERGRRRWRSIRSQQGRWGHIDGCSVWGLRGYGGGDIDVGGVRVGRRKAAS